MDRFTDLQAKIQSTRGTLDGLAGRAATMRARLAAALRAEAPAPVRPQGALAASLTRLEKASAPHATLVDAGGDDGNCISDAWEIALINEEGK
jgi:hypothetical protein